MKKENAAAIFAAVLMTLCACTQSTLPDTAPAATTQTEQAEASVSESKPAEMPAQSTPEAALSSDSFLDEPQTVQADLDEVVTYTFRLPKLTLEDADASAAVNACFEDLLSSLERYADETVYPAALERQAMAFLDGDYSITASVGVLTVVYTVSERYGADGATVTHDKTYQFDLTTGAQLAE